MAQVKFNYDRGCKIKINDDWWEFYIVTEEEAIQLDEKLNDDSGGFRALTLTGIDGQCIFFVEGNINKKVISHELLHLYCSYLCLGSTEVDRDDFEEIMAEFIEENLDKFIRIRNKIFNKLIKIEGAN